MLFAAAILDHFRAKMFTLLLPKDSKSLKVLDIRLREVGGKKTLKWYLKSEQIKPKNL